MQLAPGMKLRIADRFRRDHFLPESLWIENENRNASPEEAAVLGWHSTGGAGEATDPLLLELPGHLLRRWHALLQGMSDAVRSAAIDPDLFNKLSQETVAYLRFKQVDLPTLCSCVLEARQVRSEFGRDTEIKVGQPTIFQGGFRLAFNLSQELAPLYFVNLSEEEIEARWGTFLCGPEVPPSEKWRLFRHRFPSYPAVRLDLLPGQGFGYFTRCPIHERASEGTKAIIWLVVGDAS